MSSIAPTARRVWSYEDLLALPDDGKRYEIIEGELFEMSGPISEHALAIINLIARLLPMVTARGGQLLTAPVDVFMRGANPVQPDIIFLLANQLDLISRRGIEGAPALLIEVLSPSNPNHDLVRKRALYARAGVPEYWLVDPEARWIEVLVLEDDTYRTLVRAGGEELVASAVLPELSFPASAVFAGPGARE